MSTRYGQAQSMTRDQRLIKREEKAWRAFMEMQEVLRGRIEQQLLLDRDRQPASPCSR